MVIGLTLINYLSIYGKNNVSLSQINPKRIEVKSMKDKKKLIRLELCHLIKKAYTPKSYAENAYLEKSPRKIKKKCRRGNK